jgi:WD40 repeat protein
MNLVQVAAEGKQYDRATQLLDQQRPAAGQADLRGFEWHYWQRKLQRGRLRSVEVPQLASLGSWRRIFSHDATRLAVFDYRSDSRSSAGHGLLAVFDGVTGRELLEPFDPFPDQQPGQFVGRPLTMSEDATRIAVEIHNRDSSYISIRDGGSGSEICRIEVPGSVSDIKLTSNGSRIAVAFFERGHSRIGVNVWDTSTGNLVQPLPLLPFFYSESYYRILWSPDGTRLLRQSLSREATDGRREFRALFQIVDVASGEELWQREMPSRDKPQNAFSWSPDGKLLVIFERAQPGITVKPNVQLWDSGTGTTLAILDREDPLYVRFESTVDFSSDSKRLAVAVGGEIYVWEVPELPLAAGASPLRIAAPHLTLQTSGTSIQALAFSADGRELHSVDSGPSIVTWDATAGEETGMGPDSNGELFLTTISPNATKIAFQKDSSRQMCIWDLVKNQEVCRLKSNAGVPDRLPVFSPDGRHVALVFFATTPDGESQIVIHDAQTGVVLNVIRVDKLDSTFPARILNLEFRPDGRQIAALIGNSNPILNQGPPRLVAWDAATGTQVFSIATDVSKSRALWYSFDGTSLFVSGRTGRSEEAAVFYDANTGERQRSTSLPSDPGSTFARYYFNLRHQVFGGVVGSDFVLGDLATGQERLRLRGYNDVDAMAISPDGSRLVLLKRLLGGSELTFWSLKSGRRLLAFSLASFVTDVSFSPDGNRLVAAVFIESPTIKSKPIQIWDATPLPEEPETK